MANVHLIQRALYRAQTVHLQMWGDEGSLLRAATSRGLLATASCGIAGETVLELVGPLALFHRTSVYARALGQLVPLLATCDRFELELACETGSATYVATLTSPVLLPFARVDRAGTGPATRLARELVRLAPESRVTVTPPPIAAGSSLVCPDLVLDDRWYVELVGFWTAEYLVHKLARYRAAGLTRVVLCVDEARGCTIGDLPAGAVGFTRRVDAERVLAAIRGSPDA